jgi:hypothetical protein
VAAALAAEELEDQLAGWPEAAARHSTPATAAAAAEPGLGLGFKHSMVEATTGVGTIWL